MFLFGVVQVKKQKTIVSSWVHRKFNFLEKSIFSIGYIKKKSYLTNTILSRFQISNNFFLMKCENMTLQLELAK